MHRVGLLLGLAALGGAAASPDPGMVCSGCAVLSTLAQEGAPVPWARLRDACEGESACLKAVAGFKAAASPASAALGESPDEVCQDMGLCDGQCLLFDPELGPAWPVDLPPAPPVWPVEEPKPAGAEPAVAATPLTTRIVELLESLGHLVASSSPLKDGDIDCDRFDIECVVLRFADYHYPLVDRDGDRFNAYGYGTLRGFHWRGKDCDAKEDAIYPGRKSSSFGDDVDYDCNGISGSDASGVSYEEQFCSGTERRGLVILGDSATAHFHVPPAWLTANGWDPELVFSNQSRLLIEDEVDVPYCSWGTGHFDAESCPYAFGYNISSIYKFLKGRNRCNHRDFQNIGVNGARITSSMPLVESMARDAEQDHPLLVILSLMGNDVCNGHPGSDHMTTVDDFYQHAMESLTALDAKVPKNSHVLTVGLVDGRVLYDSMYQKQHPLGPTYPQFYEFLSCNGVNPCWGWLNTNETWRNFTSERAANLTQVYVDIQANTTWENFTHIHYTPDFRALIDEYVADYGGEASDVIEPSDGFHPSQLGNTLFAQAMWDYIRTNYPDAVGAINPFNDDIDRLFGDQGGY